LTTITNPEYLFEFVNDQTDTEHYCILTDASSTPVRFNEFTIIDATDVTFDTDGYYTYNIYEQANGSGNLDPTGLTKVEEGRVHVYVVDVAPNEYENTTETRNAYEPE
jgi:hypothetical protein